ncbi:Cdc53 [Kluyveromyces lactis]|nr:Cdc53 [Kluyveromyces lactis]
MADTLPRSDDLEATWNFVKPGIDQILDRDGTSDIKTNRVQKVLSPRMYMEVYTAIYNYCVNKSRSTGHFQSDVIGKQMNQSSILVGGEIYENLKNYLKDYISNLKKDDNVTFLNFYVRRWERFTIGAIFLNRVFDYMNRYWVQKERSDGKRHIFDAHTLCLMTWKEVMFETHKTELVTEIFDQLDLQRRGELVNKSAITIAIKSFVILGIDPSDLKKLNLNVYIQNFEQPFLQKTKEYYTKMSNEFLESHSVSEYIEKANECIIFEEKDMILYLDSHTSAPLSTALNQVLIADHADRLKNEFILLLDKQDQRLIKLIYELMKRDYRMLPDLVDTFDMYIKRIGNEEIDKLIDAHNKSAAQDSNAKRQLGLSPRDYLKCLIGVYKLFYNITIECFENHPAFAKALDYGCRCFINNNSFAIPPGSPKFATSRTPEMLAKYSDQLLKKSTKNNEQVDLTVDDIMTVFKFLADKDAFEMHYRKNLAKRLIHGSSKSEADEEIIIQRLQSENSLEYTSKITKMLQDVKLSKNLHDEFSTFISQDENNTTSAATFRSKVPELEPLILADNVWPFSYQPTEFALPPVLEHSKNKLESMYTDKHSGRILKWLWPMSRGEIKAHIGKPGKPPFQFTVTIFQMAILTLFNDIPTLTFEQIQERTNLKATQIASNMYPFVKMKLLIQSPEGVESMIKLDTKYTLNKPYRLSKTSVNFAAAVKNDLTFTATVNGSALDETEASEQKKAEKELNQQRLMFLRACIVRIMKAKRKLPHSSLMNECIAESQQRFNAKVSMIKKAVDNLIEQEYLKRTDDGECYEYLA